MKKTDGVKTVAQLVFAAAGRLPKDDDVVLAAKTLNTKGEDPGRERSTETLKKVEK